MNKTFPNLDKIRKHRGDQFHIKHIVSDEFTESSKASPLFTKFQRTGISLILCEYKRKLLVHQQKINMISVVFQ